MDARAVAGPSSRPYGASSSSAAYASAAAAGPSVYANGVPSTSNGTSRLQNGHDDTVMTDAAAATAIVEAQNTKRTSGTFHMSDGILSKAVNKKLRTGYCYSTKMQMHKVVDPSDDEIHPETPERIAFIFKRLQETGTIARMDRIAIREAVKAEASLVHAEELWDTIQSFSLQPFEFFLMNQQYFHKLSLYVNEHTAMCARLSLGGVIETCRAVAEERVSNAFAIVRPPGHHAEPEQSMGFCFYNNVAVAAAYLKTVYKTKGIRKILILDWDVHHGNGTQKAFWDDPDILYISIHRHDGGTFYPATDYGGADQVGGPKAKGGCVNIPWDGEGATDADYIYAFQKVVMPIAYEFAPDFVIVSAGFDAAEGDQLGGCHVSPAGYGHMTHMLSSLANGRLVVALEGGYNIESIAASALECVKVLLGETPPQMPAMHASEEATIAVHEVQLIQSRYWTSIQPTSMAKEDMQDAGPLISVTDILKAHRTHHLWDKYKLYNVPISVPALQEAFRDQLLLTDNVFKAKTIVLYVHDMGNLRAELNAVTADIVAENTFLIDTSSRIVEWTTDPLRNWALIDINILAHSGSRKLSNRESAIKKERALVLHVWDHVIQLATLAENVILIGQAAGCHAIVNLLNERSTSCMKRVRAAVQIFDMQKPPVIAGSERIPGLRAWFHNLSMSIFPARHQVLEDESRVGKRYGKVFISKDPRPSHVMSEWLEDIQRFLVERLGERLIPIPDIQPDETEDDTPML